MRETLEFTRMVDRISAAVKTIPQRAATHAVNFSKERFRAQNWVDNITEPWKKRKTRDKRPGRAILVNKGRLRRSIRKIIVTMDYAMIGTDAPGAKANNDGFRGTVTVNQHKRRNYKSVRESYKTKSGKTRSRTNKLSTGSYIVKSHKRRMNLPRRRFIGVSAVLDSQLQRMIVSEITRAIKFSNI